MRELVTRYNTLLRDTYIDIDLRGYPSPVNIDLSHKTTKRIFNDGSWERGGRFYGGWWQGLSKELRSRIVIRDKPTREMDYRGLHVVVLYALKGIDYFREFDQDPYKIDGYDYAGESGELYRDLFKLVLLCALNAKDQATARKAVQNEINKDIDGRYPRGTDLGKAISYFVKKHAPISECFFSGDALRLQNLDSRVAERVIEHMTDRERPVLCIHDSFICQRSEVDFLTGLLVNQLNEVLLENKAMSQKLLID